MGDHQFVVCVDSDGTVMDTMEEKHHYSFGPRAVEVFGLAAIREPFLETWNDVNLYSRSRGVNRFLGLVETFEQMEARGYPMPDIRGLKTWTETADELSDPSLKAAWERTNDASLRRTLDWNEAVNQSIANRAGHDRPFEGVQQGLATIHEVADVIVVSTAAHDTLVDEWSRHNLLSYVDTVMGHEAGSKIRCLQDVLSRGYASEKMLMVGDAPGDYEAARQVGAHFFPILVGRESESWQTLVDDALPRLVSDQFTEAYQAELLDAFKRRLS